MLLVDSGGQYLRGTSDVTRTIALGPVTPAMKKDYTLSLKECLLWLMQSSLKAALAIVWTFLPGDLFGRKIRIIDAAQVMALDIF